MFKLVVLGSRIVFESFTSIDWPATPSDLVISFLARSLFAISASSVGVNLLLAAVLASPVASAFRAFGILRRPIFTRCLDSSAEMAACMVWSRSRFAGSIPSPFFRLLFWELLSVPSRCNAQRRSTKTHLPCGEILGHGLHQVFAVNSNNAGLVLDI